MYCRSIVYAFFIVSGWSALTCAESSTAEHNATTHKCLDIGDCPMINMDCEKKCGCDKFIPTIMNNETGECEINTKLLMLSLTEKYSTQDDEMSTEDDVFDMATKIRAEADRIFRGVIVAAFLFIICASICTLSACMYCCRINYTDYRLKKSIKILAKKVGKKSQLRKSSAKTPTAPMAESCNVVVEDAGVFCV